MLYARSRTEHARDRNTCECASLPARTSPRTRLANSTRPSQECARRACRAHSYQRMRVTCLSCRRHAAQVDVRVNTRLSSRQCTRRIPAPRSRTIVASWRPYVRALKEALLLQTRLDPSVRFLLARLDSSSRKRLYLFAQKKLPGRSRAEMKSCLSAQKKPPVRSCAKTRLSSPRKLPGGSPARTRPCPSASKVLCLSRARRELSALRRCLHPPGKRREACHFPMARH